MTHSTTNAAAREVVAEMRAVYESGREPNWREMGSWIARLTATLTQQQGGEQEAGDCVVLNGTRAEWQTNFGDWLPATITGWRPATYDARLDDGTEALGYPVGRFRFATTALRSKQAAGEAVAWWVQDEETTELHISETTARIRAAQLDCGTVRVFPLYTTPPRHPAEEGIARDAARYRWLRANMVVGRMESRGPHPDFAMNCDEPESEWDAAIDAALAGSP